MTLPSHLSFHFLHFTFHAREVVDLLKNALLWCRVFSDGLSTEEESVAARLIDGKALALQVRERLATESAAVLAKTGMKPGLATILVGDDPASHLYVKSKQKACDAAGIYIDDHKLPASTTQAELLALIEKENADPKIHGILVQLPLPKHIDSKVVLEAVSPDKDADGFHPYNFGRLVEGHPVFEACTPKGVIKMIESTGVSIEGKRAVVLGRSNIVGKPLALMLLQRHATVTICHSKTKDLPAVCREAELLLVAIGKAKFVTADMVREGAVVIDVGTNKTPEGKLCGDVDFEPVSQKAGWISPVPGGVGPMTIAMLLDNTVESAKRMAGML
jgi:methylenetetrahydrofolate dehydrogenase (NADP+)/methenyltetrahydrofolate cyclohydrolase